MMGTRLTIFNKNKKIKYLNLKKVLRVFKEKWCTNVLLLAFYPAFFTHLHTPEWLLQQLGRVKEELLTF